MRRVTFCEYSYKVVVSKVGLELIGLDKHGVTFYKIGVERCLLDHLLHAYHTYKQDHNEGAQRNPAPLKQSAAHAPELFINHFNCHNYCFFNCTLSIKKKEGSHVALPVRMRPCTLGRYYHTQTISNYCYYHSECKGTGLFLCE